MATTQLDIRGWFKRGLQQKATHMIVVCDTFDYKDYPVYVKVGENVHTKVKEYDGVNMQKVMEVYKIGKPLEEQIKERRSFNY